MGAGGKAMRFYIYYRDDGEIVGWGSGHEAAPVEDALVAYVWPFDVDPIKHKFDGNGVVLKSEEEQRRSRLPKLQEVKTAVWLELCRTDKFMLADFPIDEFEHRAWRVYRKALRDLSKGRDDAADMISALDIFAPDNIDPFSELRKRL